MSEHVPYVDNPRRRRPPDSTKHHDDDDNDDQRNYKNTISSNRDINKINTTGFPALSTMQQTPVQHMPPPVTPVRESSWNITVAVTLAIVVLTVTFGVLYIGKQYFELEKAKLQMNQQLEETKLKQEGEQKIRESDYKLNEMKHKYNQTITKLQKDAEIAHKRIDQGGEKEIELKIKEIEAERDIRIKELELEKKQLEMQAAPAMQIENKEEKKEENNE